MSIKRICKFINLNYQDKSLVIERNILSNLDYKIFDDKFNIIFIDPPYKEKNLQQILIKIFETNILSNEGVIIIHRHKKEKDNFLDKFKVIEEKTYGISRVIFGNFL